MKFVSLIDLKAQRIVSINGTYCLVSTEVDNEIRELRVQPWAAEFLYALFKRHPNILTYPEILKIFQTHHLLIADTTRMHRRISEIRKILEALKLENFIINSRNIGYLLPLEFKNIDSIEKKPTISFHNKNVEESLRKIEGLVHSAVEATIKCEVISHDDWYVMDRDPTKGLIASNLDIFDKCATSIIHEAQLHNADFNLLRLQYIFAKLKTYIGLARISEYSISKNQWLEWFKTEIYQTFAELERALKGIFR
jgi:DNA-binding winged helix-turn-helix (wHTH) protein